MDAHYAVTAAHCLQAVDPKTPLKFLDEDNNDLNVTITGRQAHETTDLGLIIGDFNNFLLLPVNFKDMGFVPGVPMLACGYPFGQPGLGCNTVIPIDNNELVIRVKGFLRNGQSGGPVIGPDGVAYGVNYAIGDGFSAVNSLQGFRGLFGI